MTFTPPVQKRGIALIIVMVVIMALTILVAVFSFNMRVEMNLARNASHETEMFWLGWSGAQLACYALAQQMTNPQEPYDSLNQKWAGGPGSTNDGMSEITLEDIHLGNGVINRVTITDMERKFNINVADETILRQAMVLMGVDAAVSAPAIDSILDWIDQDDMTRVSGWETQDYEMLPVPYMAKNGPMDDMSELLLVNGVTPEIYWGPAISQHAVSTPAQREANVFNEEVLTYPYGLVDLFNTLGGQININTASMEALQVVPGIDENIALGIIQARSGLDGVDGTEDDLPFHNAGELRNVPGLNNSVVGQLQRYFAVRSVHFRVEVDAQVDQARRHFVAMIRRTGPQDVKVLYMNWE
jgi:general secretion pathway protein K